MGIDVYLVWPDQTEAERTAQFTGFSVTSGDVGYLREAYHGEPYATRELAPEAFNGAIEYREDGSWDDGAAIIPAATLRQRLPKVIDLAIERERKLYHAGETQYFEPENVGSDLLAAQYKADNGFNEWFANRSDVDWWATHRDKMRKHVDRYRENKSLITQLWLERGPELLGGHSYKWEIHSGRLLRTLNDADETHPTVRAFIDFVELAEKVEALTGKVAVYASY